MLTIGARGRDEAFRRSLLLLDGSDAAVSSCVMSVAEGSGRTSKYEKLLKAVRRYRKSVMADARSIARPHPPAEPGPREPRQPRPYAPHCLQGEGGRCVHW